MRHSVRIALRGYAGAAAVAAFIVLLASTPEAWSRDLQPARCQYMTERLAQALFDRWNDALQQTPDKVTLTYAPSAVLLPTFESGPLIGHQEIRGYFVEFLKKHPVGRIDKRAIVRAGCNTGVVAGLYTFTVDKQDAGAEQKARVDNPARYTYVYTYRPDARRWLITHHHSSAQPPKDGGH